MTAPSETRFYVVLRDHITGGALGAYCAHAGREAGPPAPTKDENVTILVTSKLAMASAAFDLERLGFQFKKFLETDGKMADCITHLAFAIYEADRDKLPDSVKKLRPWSEKARAEAAARP